MLEELVRLPLALVWLWPKFTNFVYFLLHAAAREPWRREREGRGVGTHMAACRTIINILKSYAGTWATPVACSSCRRHGPKLKVQGVSSLSTPCPLLPRLSSDQGDFRA